jgi:hypothetical protein
VAARPRLGADRLLVAAGLQCGQARVDLGGLVELVEGLELRVQGRCRHLLLADDDGLLAAHLLFEAAELAGGVQHVDALQCVGDLRLRLRGLGAGHQFVALRGEFVELLAHPLQAGLELLDDIVLGGDRGFGGLGLVLGRDLLAQRHLGELVELVGTVRIARGAQFVALGARGQGLAPPVRGGGDILGVVLLHEPQVADGLGDSALGLGDAVRVVAHELVEHHLRVLGLIEQGVDVRAQKLRDAPEDGLLSHGVPF